MWKMRAGEDGPSIRAVVVLGAVARAVVLFGAPVLSDDLWRFLWDGRVLLSGTNPFRHAPDAVDLARLRDDAWRSINNAEIRTIYPPLAQVLFGAVALVGGGERLLRAAVVALDLGCVALVARAGERRGIREAGIAYALCPLAVVEPALSAHFDGIAATLVLVAVLAIDRSKLRAGVALGLSVASKLLALVALPAIALGRPRSRGLVAAGIALAIAALAFVPFAGAGLRTFGGLSEFALRWSGNASGFVVLESGARAALRPFETRAGAVRVPVLGRLSKRLAGTPFDPRGPLHRPKKAEETDVFATGYLASFVARVLATLLVLGFAVFFAVRGPPDRAALAALALALLVGPVVHPWYVLWLLPFAAVQRQAPWLLWATLAPLALLPLDAFRATGEWIEPAWIRIVEYAPVYAAIAWGRMRSHGGGQR